MKIKTIIKRTMLTAVLPIAALLASCEDDNYMKFNLANSGIYLDRKSVV